MSFKNVVLTILGLMAFALAMLGVIVPGLPTTPFLILASMLFCKSHPRLYHWVISHPRWGAGIRSFNEHHIIRVPIKIWAIAMMTVMITLSILFYIENTLVEWLLVLLGVIGTLTVLSFPSRPTP